MSYLEEREDALIDRLMDELGLSCKAARGVFKIIKEEMYVHYRPKSVCEVHEDSYFENDFYGWPQRDYGDYFSQPVERLETLPEYDTPRKKPGISKGALIQNEIQELKTNTKRPMRKKTPVQKPKKEDTPPTAPLKRRKGDWA